jgi:Glycosyl transferases group 1/Glycosyl transferase 4-like domain
MRHKILMAVYNPIEIDGRVKRTCECLGTDFDIILMCLRGAGEYKTELYQIKRPNISLRYGAIKKLLVFWLNVIVTSWQIRPTLVYAHDIYLPFPGWVAARLTGAKLVYDAHELFVPSPDKRMTIRESFFYRLERFVVNKAELVIAANLERAEVMRKHYRLKKLPTVVRNIPPMPVSQLTTSEVLVKYSELKKSHPDDIHVVYMGDINFKRGLPVLISSLDLLPECFKLIFVGNGLDFDKLTSLTASTSNDRIRAIGAVTHAHVFDVIRQADIGFVSYSMSGVNNILCAPNKIFEYTQAGLPIVATCQPTIKALVAKITIGKLVGCDKKVSPTEVADAIRTVAYNKEKYLLQLSPFLDANTWDKESAALGSAVKGIV